MGRKSHKIKLAWMFVLTLSPFSPGIPGSPRSPFCPGWPRSPGRPISPLSPLEPFGPGVALRKEPIELPIKDSYTKAYKQNVALAFPKDQKEKVQNFQKWFHNFLETIFPFKVH